MRYLDSKLLKKNDEENVMTMSDEQPREKGCKRSELVLHRFLGFHCGVLSR